MSFGDLATSAIVYLWNFVYGNTILGILILAIVLQIKRNALLQEEKASSRFRYQIERHEEDLKKIKDTIRDQLKLNEQQLEVIFMQRDDIDDLTKRVEALEAVDEGGKGGH